MVALDDIPVVELSVQLKAAANLSESKTHKVKKKKNSINLFFVDFMLFGFHNLMLQIAFRD